MKVSVVQRVQYTSCIFVEGDRIRRGPGMAVQVCGRDATKSDPSRTGLEKHSLSQIYSEKIDLAEEEADTDCMKRFIKLKVWM